MELCFAKPDNLKDWIEVAKNVGLIMRLPDMDTNSTFLEYAKRKIEQNDAIMVYDVDKAQSAGFIGFSKHNNSITWLGVKEEYRNQGIGAKLLKCALDILNHNHRITVNTYPQGYLPGQPARRLYFKHGFVETNGEIFYIDGLEMVELSIEPTT